MPDYPRGLSFMNAVSINGSQITPEIKVHFSESGDIFAHSLHVDKVVANSYEGLSVLGTWMEKMAHIIQRGQLA
ncbi:MAG: hypothetical protein HC896_19120 [Bacteroidales bacterium]|nr:hypothetical protein [Bacteroidales bacterium]